MVYTWFIDYIRSDVGGERRLETTRLFICDCLIIEYPVRVGGERRLETTRSFICECLIIEYPVRVGGERRL